MLQVPYMKDPHSKRVWLDRCPQCRSIWFDAGEAETAAGADLHLALTANELPGQCPVCHVPLYAATLAGAESKACAKCRGVHLQIAQLPAVSFKETPDDEPTLKPPALFECTLCQRTFSLDQGDGVTCYSCAPGPTITGESAAPSRLARRIGLMSLLDQLF
ncbi:MAG: zf-TFIIB domain-containing protein [Myxococcaceae bacterium]|nr:zf-TFIIB domain-containing protein [Myxococcaceae bacterium]